MRASSSKKSQEIRKPTGKVTINIEAKMTVTIRPRAGLKKM